MTFLTIIVLIGADVRAMLSGTVSDNPIHEHNAKNELVSRKPQHRPG
jgi:hypothetical protein